MPISTLISSRDWGRAFEFAGDESLPWPRKGERPMGAPGYYGACEPFTREQVALVIRATKTESARGDAAGYHALVKLRSGLFALVTASHCAGGWGCQCCSGRALIDNDLQRLATHGRLSLTPMELLAAQGGE